MLINSHYLFSTWLGRGYWSPARQKQLISGNSVKNKMYWEDGGKCWNQWKAELSSFQSSVLILICIKITWGSCWMHKLNLDCSLKDSAFLPKSQLRRCCWSFEFRLRRTKDRGAPGTWEWKTSGRIFLFRQGHHCLLGSSFVTKLSINTSGRIHWPQTGSPSCRILWASSG